MAIWPVATAAPGGYAPTVHPPKMLTPAMTGRADARYPNATSSFLVSAIARPHSESFLPYRNRSDPDT